MPIDDILLDAEEQMEKTIEHLKHELRTVRTGRATPALVEHIKVDYYGTPTDLRQIASISVPEATQLLIRPFAAPDLKWFQPRPSNGLGTNSVNTQYKLILSGATNRSGDNKDLIDWVTAAKAAVVKDNSVPGHPVSPSDVPADAVTSSGSGLDPAISPQYAQIQVRRVAERNHLGVDQVEKLVEQHTDGRILGFVGEPRVNVLQLNIALKELVNGG